MTETDSLSRVSQAMVDLVDALEEYTAGPGRFDTAAHKLIAELTTAIRRIDR